MFLPQACIKDFIDITMFPPLRTGHLDHKAQIIKNLLGKETKLNCVLSPRGIRGTRVSLREKMKVLVLCEHSPLRSVLNRTSQKCLQRGSQK